jgi:hypothetical protein
MFNPEYEFSLALNIRDKLVEDLLTMDILPFDISSID